MNRFIALSVVAVLTLSGCCWPWYHRPDHYDDRRDYHHDDHDHDHHDDHDH